MLVYFLIRVLFFTSSIFFLSSRDTVINEDSLTRKLSDLSYQHHCSQVVTAFTMKDYSQVIRLLVPHLQSSIAAHEELGKLQSTNAKDEDDNPIKRETFNLPFHVHIQMLDYLQQAYLQTGDITASLKSSQVLLRDAITDPRNTIGMVHI